MQILWLVKSMNTKGHKRKSCNLDTDNIRENSSELSSKCLDKQNIKACNC